METSMLKYIDTYIKENGIPFKSIHISTSYFPRSFNDVISCKMLELMHLKRDNVILEYELFYYNDKLQLIARNSNETTTLVIYDSEMGCSYNNICYKMNEKEIVDYTVYLESKKALKVEEEIKRLGLIQEYNFDSSYILNALRDSASLCVEYIKYLNFLYQDMLREEKGSRFLEIMYEKPEVSTMIKRTHNNTGVGTKERINSILPIDDRKQILESYEYIYSGCAYSSTNKQFDYLCYLYNINDNQYSLIMEPIAGNGYTKTFIFGYTGPITKDFFVKIVQEHLNLSYEEALRDNQILMTKHTSLELFDSVIENIIVGTDRHKMVHPYTKDKIKIMKRGGQ